MLLTKVRLPLLLLTLPLVPACGVTYLAQAAGGQMALMRAREPIDEVLAAPDTSQALRDQLIRAKRIRDYASAELGLPDNAAYRSYSSFTEG